MTARLLRLAACVKGCGRVRGAGLAATGAGWCIAAGLLLARIEGVRTPTADLFAIFSVTMCLLFGGATLLILDALNRGFGALDNFFKEALARSSRRSAHQTRAPMQSPFDVQVLRRGTIGDRPYVILGDGTVAVETLLGRRTFATLSEAQDFIGA
jgi:hypothetical protein